MSARSTSASTCRTRTGRRRVTKPTINLFLYDVRENHELRSNQRSLVRNGAVGSERQAPVRMDLTYLISAWTTDISDEHQLLGRVLEHAPALSVAAG